jgi:putative ABC transport system permease protein
MNFFALSSAEWRRRPLRMAVTAMGVAISVAAMFSLLSFHDGYRDGVRGELDRLGAHVLVVPKGCPYDAASIALHGANWPCYLKSTYLDEVRGTPGVTNAAPVFMGALGGGDGTQSIYVGVDENILRLKPGWRLEGAFPRGSGEVLAGAAVAKSHNWRVGQTVHLPGFPNQIGTVAAILQPTHSADDGFIYTRLGDAQQWFQHVGELTHILVRLDDPNSMDQAVNGLRGCGAGMEMNIVPLAHLFRTIQSLVNSTSVLLGSVALVGLLLAATGVSNAVLMSVAERSGQIGILRAIGASRGDVFKWIWLETLQVCLAGGLAGVLLAFAGSHLLESWLRARLPFAPGNTFIQWEWWVAGACLGGALVLGSIAALLPASRAAELSPVEAMREGASV